MKLNQIAFAVAMLAAGSANAANINLNPDLVINLDGATAVAKTVENVAAYMCQAGTLGTGNYGVYTASKQVAVFCPVDGAKSGLTDGTKVFIAKNNVDGSLEALQRALMRQKVDGSQPVNSDANGYSNLLNPAACDVAAKTCAIAKAPAIGGVSDVNAGVWQSRGQFDSTLVSGGFTEYPALAGQGFGVAVTDQLYKELQVAQGLHATGSLPVNAAALTAAELAIQPSISKAQFASILGASGGVDYHGSWKAILGAAGADKKVTLCRRGENSGTQASMDSFFLNYPCSASGGASLRATDSYTEADPVNNGFFDLEVVENAGTGDVKNCLKNRKTARAIGIMSLENFASSTDGYHYVKLDGVSPNEDTTQRKATVEGRYSFIEEAYGAVRDDASDDQKAYMANFFALWGSPYEVDPLAGISVVPGTYSYDAADADLIRVGKVTRGGDACSPALLVK